MVGNVFILRATELDSGVEKLALSLSNVFSTTLEQYAEHVVLVLNFNEGLEQ